MLREEEIMLIFTCHFKMFHPQTLLSFINYINEMSNETNLFQVHNSNFLKLIMIYFNRNSSEKWSYQLKFFQSHIGYDCR